MQPFVTLSLLIKRNLQVFDRVWPKPGIEPLIIHLPDRLFSLLSYPGLVKNKGVSQTLYTKMLVNFEIFDREQYFQGPKLNYWKIAGLRPAIFSGTPRNFEA